MIKIKSSIEVPKYVAELQSQRSINIRPIKLTPIFTPQVELKQI